MDANWDGATSLAVPEPDESRDLSGILFFPTCPFRSHFQSKTRFSCPFRSRLRGVGLRKSLINYRDDFGTRIRDAGVAGSNPVTPTTLASSTYLQSNYLFGPVNLAIS